MTSELQRIVDSLGERLHRSVAIDDRRWRIQAYSPHFGPVDDTRLGSILHRQTPPPATEWVMGLGIADVTQPTRVPACERLSMLPRVCVPVGYQTTKLGYLWLIEGEVELNEEELRIASEAAEAAGVVMYRERLVSELERGREREYLRDLLAPDQALRSTAAAGLLDGELFVPGRIVVAVLRPADAGQELLAADRQVTLDLALNDARRQLPLRHALHLARPDHGLLVAALGHRASISDESVAVAESLLHAFGHHHRQGSPARVIVGIGQPQPRLQDAASSYRQALQAARIAEIVPNLGPVVAWSSLGIYRTLAQLPAEELTAEGLHPGLVDLLSNEAGQFLLATLECFLDHAGDIKMTSAELHIHRTSLYYRLRRIEELAGVDLGSGDDRLALHLGLKISRLAGLYPSHQAVE